VKHLSIVAYYNSSESLSEGDVIQSMELLKRKLEKESTIRMGYELRPEPIDHEKNSTEFDGEGNQISGIRRPPPHRKERIGNRISANFSRTLSCFGCGGLRDFCIRTDKAFDPVTLIHELLHALGKNPDGREKSNYPGKMVDDCVKNGDFTNWHKFILKGVESENYNLPPLE
jgi:hypothetical protein